MFTGEVNKSVGQTVGQNLEQIKIRPTINAVKTLKTKFEKAKNGASCSSVPENQKSEQSKYFTFLRFVNEYRKNEKLPERKFIEETLGIDKRVRLDLSKRALEDNIFLPKTKDYTFNTNFSEHKIKFLD